MAIDRDPTSNNFPNDYTTSGIDNRILLRSKAIREKMYGVDVREALAQGVEIGGSVAQNAKDTSDQAQKNVQSAITTLNTQMQTADATIKSMNDLNTQLADTVKKAGDIEAQSKAVLDDIQKNPDKYRGVKGDAGTIKIGTVTTTDTPSVTNTGTSSNAILNFGLVKGDKGDTGTVDNAGLTNAPAFQALQTQVNNSAVGTNLLLGTSGTLQTVTNATGWGSNFANINTNRTDLTNGTYTAGVYISPVSHNATIYIQITSTSNRSLTNIQGTAVTAGSSGYSVCTYTVPSGFYINRVFLSFQTNYSDSTQVSWKEMKLEKGSVATGYSLNPSEILTQTDYAKIKAAIVALGGSLS